MTDNPNHIEGIYNYCDRWCERCPQTSRCAVFSKLDTLSTEEKDISNKTFWENIGKSFAEALELIHKETEKRGITMPAEDDEEMNYYFAKIKAKKEYNKQHPLLKYCDEYMIAARDVLKNNTQLKELAETLNQLQEIGIKDACGKEVKFKRITDYLEVIQYYLFQIQIKFLRAMPTRDDEETIADNSSGSAKVALIATDRSLAGWHEILQQLPETEDVILTMLVLLQKIQKLGEITFPAARSFVRVGLDDDFVS